MAAIAPQPQPQTLNIALPPQPHDPNVHMPAAPAFPPAENDVLAAVKFRRRVDASRFTRPDDDRCTLNDRYNSILYEHGVVGQAVAAAGGPQAMAPPWFQVAFQQLRQEIQQLRQDVQQLCQDVQNVGGTILPLAIDIRRLMNQRREDGIVPFEIVPFVNGNNPTQPPINLPPLVSINAIDNLDEDQLVQYLNGYGLDPAPVGPDPLATNRLRKDTLKALVGILDSE